MRAGYLWLASFLVYPIVGAPFFKRGRIRDFGFPARAVLSGGVGMVIVSWTMNVFALGGLRWGPSLVLAGGIVSLSLALLLRGEGREEISVPRVPRGGPGEARSATAVTVAAATVTALSVLAALAATIAGRSTSPDLLFFWGPKAQQFAQVRTIDAGFLSAPLLEYLHVYYPPLVTNVLAFGAMIAGRFPWGAVTLTFPILLAATAIGLAGILRRTADDDAASSTTALATSAVALLGIHASVAGNAEPFLLFYEALGVAVLLSPIAATRRGKLLAGLLLAGAAASKVEGLPFVGAAALLFFVVKRENRRAPVRTLLFVLGPTAVSLGTWFAFGAAHRLFYGYRGYGRFLDVHWDHLDEVLSGFGWAFWKAGRALPFAVPLLVFLLARGKTRSALVPFGTAVALVLFFGFTYLHSETDPRLWMIWSAARVLSPLTVLLSLAAFAASRGEPPERTPRESPR
jgi:hypothetical protein